MLLRPVVQPEQQRAHVDASQQGALRVEVEVCRGIPDRAPDQVHCPPQRAAGPGSAMRQSQMVEAAAHRLLVRCSGFQAQAHRPGDLLPYLHGVQIQRQDGLHHAAVGHQQVMVQQFLHATRKGAIDVEIARPGIPRRSAQRLIRPAVEGCMRQRGIGDPVAQRVQVGGYSRFVGFGRHASSPSASGAVSSAPATRCFISVSNIRCFRSGMRCG